MAVDTSVSLLLRLRRGSDSAAWERFVELYTPVMYRWAEQLGAQAADSADLIQDVFILLVRTLPRFEYDRDRSFRAWLRTVVANKWRERHRRKSPQYVSGSHLELAAGLDDDSAWDDAQDRAAICRQALELIRPEFSPTTWTAFSDTAVHGRSVTEVAEALKITANAVYLARGRVLKRLRQELEGLWE